MTTTHINAYKCIFTIHYNFFNMSAIIEALHILLEFLKSFSFFFLTFLLRLLM